MNHHFFYSITLLICFLSFNLKEIRGQEDHLQTILIGPKSTLIGGAVVSSVRDNSAIFYNPGVLGFLQNSSISFSGNLYNFEYAELKNGAGDNINLYGKNAFVTPEFVSGVFKFKKIPNFTFTYGIFNKKNSKLTLKERVNILYNAIEPNPGDENVVGDFDYRNEIKDDWLGIGAGFKLTKNISVGVSTFVTLLNQKYYENISHTIYSNSSIQSTDVLFAKSTQLLEAQYTVVQNIWKAGLAFENEFFNIGVVFTTPSIKIPISLHSFMNRNHYFASPSINNQLFYSDYQTKLPTTFYTPAIFDIGVEFIFYKFTLSSSFSYATGVKAFTIMEFDPEILTRASNTDAFGGNFNSLKYATKPTLNWAIGIQRPVNEKLKLLAGFRTNKNTFDNNAIDRMTEWVATKSRWNLYHATGGIEFTSADKHHIVLGVQLGFGRSRNKEQFVNLSSPNENNFFQGEIQNNVNAKIIHAGLIFGLTLNFFEKEQKDLFDELKGD